MSFRNGEKQLLIVLSCLLLFDEPGNPAVEELTRLIEENVIAGIGEIGTQLNGISPNDPKLDPYFALAEELDRCRSCSFT